MHPVSSSRSLHRLLCGFVTLSDLLRLAVGWGTFFALTAIGALDLAGLGTGLIWLLVAAIIAAIVISAFGVVRQAEALGHRLGDPYGSLVLTLSIVMIEVVLIVAVMGGSEEAGEHATIARDSVMAVSMIIMNLVIGLALLLGGLRHGAMAANRTGTSQYLAILTVLITIAFALPVAIGEGGSFSASQEIPIVIVVLGSYGFFLFRQMGAQASDFREVSAASGVKPAGADITGLREHWPELVVRFALLVATVLPIVLLSHHMAALLDTGLDRLSAPAALTGVVIAAIVFLPESLTSFRAALAGQIQRVSNLCHGGLASTVGITIPAVLIVGLATNQPVVLAESPANLLLLGATMLVSVATFSSKKVTASHGVAHLALFAIYAITLLSW